MVQWHVFIYRAPWRCAGENEAVRRAVGRAPISGRGVRILAMDGGGMKASSALLCDASLT
jgi:hypothetical protein